MVEFFRYLLDVNVLYYNIVGILLIINLFLKGTKNSCHLFYKIF